MTDITEEMKLGLQRRAQIPHIPTDLTYECRMAIEGEGPRAGDWADKPHRLVFDLCRELERLRLSLSEARATGRRDGMEEAARIADASSKEWRKDADLWRKDGMIKVAAASMLHCEAADMVAAAIRAAMEKAE